MRAVGNGSGLGMLVTAPHVAGARIVSEPVTAVGVGTCGSNRSEFPRGRIDTGRV